MTALSLVSSALARAYAITRRFDFVGPLVARITLGVLFVSTGWGKVHSLDQVTGFFMELGIPAPGFHAHLVSFVELFGGALLVVGLASRLSAVPLMISMLVAIVTAQREQVHGLADLFGLVEWTYFALLLWIALAGPGKLSLDSMLFARRASTRKSAEPIRPAMPAEA